MNTEKIVIAVTGTLCSGKGAVAKILQSKGCDIDTFSSVIRDELKSRGILEPDRITLQNEGNRLRKEFGGQVLAERLLLKHSNSIKPLVIDGLRNIGELDYLKENSDFVLIGIDASIESRWAFTQKRKTSKDFIDYDDFLKLEARDRGFNEPLNGQQVGMCLAQADYLIYNDEQFDKLEDSKLYKEVGEIYRKIMKNK